MLAAIYDPYLDTLGGGERYTLTFGKTLLNLGYEVDIFWDDSQIKSKLEDRFGIDPALFNFIPNIFIHRNFIGTGSFLKNYDLVFIVSDGSIPVMTGRKNLLHFQVPFQNVNGKKIINRLKLRFVNQIICNSHFTKRIIDREYGVDSVVVYPPVNTTSFLPQQKKKLILSVGRFSSLLQSKRHDVLVNSFKQMFQSPMRDWKLVLAGGSEVGRTSDLDVLRASAKGFPIEIIENPSFTTLKALYGQASLFWFASGFEIDEQTHPEKVEHFGMSVAESMSAGCVPLVHPKGGITEIVEDKKTGLYWNTPDELVQKTKDLIQDASLLKKLSENARQKAADFSESNFFSNIKDLVTK